MASIKKKLLISVAGIVAVVAGTAPFWFGPAALYWQKKRAWSAMEKFSPEVRKNLNATPILITLPTPPAQPMEAVTVGALVIHVPAATSHTIKSESLTLVYPAFSVWILPVSSNTRMDADCQKVYGKTWFEREEQVFAARMDDIDIQPDLPSLSAHLLLLADKVSGLSRITCFEKFKQADRHGFIQAVDPLKHRLHVELFLFPADLGCGIYFMSDAGVNPADVERYIAAVEIEAASPASASAPTR